MEIETLLERVIAQNEKIIRQNVELLLVLSVLVEKRSDGKTNDNRDLAIRPEPSSKNVA